MPTAVVFVMALIIIVLASYAGWLLLKLLRQRHKKRANAAVQVGGSNINKSSAVQFASPAGSPHQLEHRESIQVLARCVVQQQVSTTEAAIRITVLARALPADEPAGEFYAAFANLATATAHIPILQAWQDLSNTQRKAFERERLELEKAHHTQIMAAANALLTLQ